MTYGVKKIPIINTRATHPDNCLLNFVPNTFECSEMNYDRNNDSLSLVPWTPQDKVGTAVFCVSMYYAMTHLMVYLVLLYVYDWQTHCRFKSVSYSSAVSKFINIAKMAIALLLLKLQVWIIQILHVQIEDIITYSMMYMLLLYLQHWQTY